MSNKSTVSLVGGGVEFHPLPTSDLPGVVAARKARAEKRDKVIKIGAVVVIVLAAVAGLAAYLVSGSHPHQTDNKVSVETLPARMARSLDEVGGMEEVAEISKSNWDLSTRLYSKVSESESGNLAMSPFSVSSVMAMLVSGAAGTTLSELLKAMAFPRDSNTLTEGYGSLLPHMVSDENITLETANSAFIQADFNVLKQFEMELARNFAAEFKGTNFQNTVEAADLINAWVEEKTHNKIKDLITSDMLNAMVKMVLVNAIYFKGDWATKFNPASTDQGTFYLSPEEKVEVAMMTQEARFFTGEAMNSRIVELPYKGERVSMYIVLPKAVDGLQDLEQAIVQDPKTMNEYMSRERLRGHLINLSMPKFKIESSVDLTENLKALGMESLFEEGRADLSGITGNKQLFVSQVVQKAFIEVNEEGSEAAAATGAIMMLRSMPLPPDELRFDHPFLFFIKDKVTGMLLFQGRVTDPR